MTATYPWMISALLLWWLFLATYRPHSLDLTLLSVPPQLVEKGFSGPVVTERLLVAIRKMHVQTQAAIANTAVYSTVAPMAVDIPADASMITLPATDVSIDALAKFIRSSLPGNWKHEVSGEFTASGPNLSLQLRIDGGIAFSETFSDPDTLDKVIDTAIDRGAFEVVRQSEPYVAAASLYGQGYKEDARITADKIIATFHGNAINNVAYAHNLKGVIAQDQKKIEEAIAEYRTAIELDPKIPAPYNNLGTVLENQGKFQEAIDKYREAIGLDKNIAIVYVNLANTFREQGNILEAVNNYNAAISLDPKYPHPYNDLADILAKQSKMEEAILKYRAAIRLDPNAAYPHNRLGDVLQERGRLDDATFEYQEAIDLDPKFAPPHVGFARLLKKQGKIDLAAAEFQEALRLDPNSPVPHYALGQLMLEVASPETGSTQTRQLQTACGEFAEGRRLAASVPDSRSDSTENIPMFHGRNPCPPH